MATAGLSRRRTVRRLGVLTETVHAVVYFAPEPLEAYAGLGLHGYWRGYFASRAAALGSVGSDVVTPLFGGFAPAMVERYLPAVWAIATPESVLMARRGGALRALQRLVGTDQDATVEGAAELTRRCVDALDVEDHPMARAVRDQPRPDRPLAELWHDCTVLREHRGDAHLAAVADAGIAWPVPHLLKGDLVDARQQALRGWDDTAWQQAAGRSAGLDLGAVEEATDEDAARAYAVLDDAEIRNLEAHLETVARLAANAVPYPNAMGLPRLDEA